MARNVAECDTMIAACDRAGVTLGVVFQSRFERLSISLKETRSTPAGSATCSGPAPTPSRIDPMPAPSGPWQAHRRRGGRRADRSGDSCGRSADLAGRYARDVHRPTHTLNHAIEVEDATLALFEYLIAASGSSRRRPQPSPAVPNGSNLGSQGGAVYHEGQARASNGTWPIRSRIASTRPKSARRPRAPWTSLRRHRALRRLCRRGAAKSAPQIRRVAAARAWRWWKRSSRAAASESTIALAAYG